MTVSLTQYAQIVLIYALSAFLFPGSNVIFTIGLVEFLIEIPLIIVYSYIAAPMPRSGEMEKLVKLVYIETWNAE